MPEAKINNINIYYELRGEGEPLLLIAGLGGDHSSWLPAADGLSKNFRLVLFDNRGAGRSSVPEAPYPIREMADDALQLLDLLKIDSAHLIGHSMGGYIAQEFAINYPERVKKLVLEGTAPVSSTRNNLLFENFHRWRRDGMSLEDWFRVWIFWLFSPSSFEEKDFVDTFLRESLAYPYLQTVPGFQGQVGAIASFDARGRLEKIGAETLVITGKEDILIKAGESELLLEGIAGSARLRLETAHCIHLEKPKIFIEGVEKFLLAGRSGERSCRADGSGLTSRTSR